MSRSTLSRQYEIYNLLLGSTQASVKELALHFGVSTETIRKDLDVLESQGRILKKHGIAIINSNYNELPLDIKIGEHALEKQAIALLALEHIPDHAMVFLDPGSTTLALTKYLPLKKGLTIVTNSLAIANLVSDMKHDLILVGGKLQKKGKAFVGAFTSNNINTLSIDIAIMGCDGFKGCDGPTTFSFEEVLIKQRVIQRSKTKILVCDSSKFENQGTYTFADFKDYDILITNPIEENQKSIVKDIKEIYFAKPKGDL